jgi:FixJ family two-component response regulator
LCPFFIFPLAGSRAFASAEHFLQGSEPDVPGCLLLEFALPGMNGFELQRALHDSARTRPTVYVTGRGDIQTAVQAMKHGAVDFLTKPVDDTRLFAAVDRAMRIDADVRNDRAVRGNIQTRLEALTRRERRVLEHVINGRLNKLIGADMGIGEKTVKVHRMQVMKKMGVRSVAELVRVAARVGIENESSGYRAGKSGGAMALDQVPISPSTNHE